MARSQNSPGTKKQNSNKKTEQAGSNPAVPGSLIAMANGGAGGNEFTAISSSAGQAWSTVNITPAADGLAGGTRYDGAAAVDAFGNVHVAYIQDPATGRP